MSKNSCLDVYFDGKCPICSREVAFIQRRDSDHQIRFTDISASDFDATEIKLELHVLNQRIHARTPEGTVVTAVEVFRRIYWKLGYHRLVTFSRQPLVAHVLDWGYARFAQHRLRLSRWFDFVYPRAGRQRFLTK